MDPPSVKWDYVRVKAMRESRARMERRASEYDPWHHHHHNQAYAAAFLHGVAEEIVEGQSTPINVALIVHRYKAVSLTVQCEAFSIRYGSNRVQAFALAHGFRLFMGPLERLIFDVIVSGGGGVMTVLSGALYDLGVDVSREIASIRSLVWSTTSQGMLLLLSDDVARARDRAIATSTRLALRGLADVAAEAKRKRLDLAMRLAYMALGA